jgi:glycosyltransferase involved in cell wall biosynthesis
MKIAVTLSRIPYPLEKGDKLRAYHQVKTLIEAGHDVHVICFHFEKKDTNSLEELKKIGGTWHYISLSKWRIPLSALQGIWSQLPWQVLLFHQIPAQKKFNQVIADVQPDVLYAQMIRTAEYSKFLIDIHKTLDYMDALSLGIEKRISKSNWISQWFWKDEFERVQKYESLIAHYFEHLTIIAQKDANAIHLPENKKLIILPNGIDFQYFKAEKIAKENVVLFTGNMNYPPNVEAALRLGKNIMPLVWKQFPAAKLLIAGAEPHRSLMQELRDPRIEITGWMDDIRDAYLAGKIFAAPMTMGSGMQNKILEALSMGLPVVCSDLAADAFESELKSELLVAQTDTEFAQTICQCLAVENDMGSQKIQHIIQNQFSWKKATVPLLSLWR